MYPSPKILISLSNISNKFFPQIPHTEITKAKDYSDLLDKSLGSNFDCIVTQLEHDKKSLGLEFLNQTKDINAKKIICTDKTRGAKKLIEDLGGIVLDKFELPTLNALAFSDAPLQKEGKILINIPSNEFWMLLPRKLQKKVVQTIYPNIVIGIFNENDLLRHLHSNQLKLIIDTSPSNYFGPNEPSILETIYRDHRFHKNSIPRLITLKNRKMLSVHIYQILKKELNSKA